MLPKQFRRGFRRLTLTVVALVFAATAYAQLSPEPLYDVSNSLESRSISWENQSGEQGQGEAERPEDETHGAAQHVAGNDAEAVPEVLAEAGSDEPAQFAGAGISSHLETCPYNCGPGGV